jgi:hypothetical protein
LDELDRLRQKQVERARYEADLAQRRYLHVDPLCVLPRYVALRWRCSTGGRLLRFQEHITYRDLRKAIKPAS